jgi:tRNA(adenine34) deaminase
MTKDEQWMKIAMEEAKLAMIENEVPVGAVLVQNDILIAKAHNQPVIKNDPTAHAEIQLLRNAGKKKGNYRLIGSTVYVTLEPCAMCFGALIHARIDRLVFGSSDFKSGACGSTIDLSSNTFFNHSIIISGGILSEECRAILKKFFILKRK